MHVFFRCFILYLMLEGDEGICRREAPVDPHFGVPLQASRGGRCLQCSQETFRGVFGD